jgi:predicted double-glycine peptidase
MKLRYPSNLLKLPNLRQVTDYTCGASALQSVLIWYAKYEDGELDLAKELNTSEEWGTEPEDIVRVAKHYGLKAEIQTNMSLEDLERYVTAHRIPVIVTYQAWSESDEDWSTSWDDGHYSIVVGIDEYSVYLEDPSLAGEIGYIPREEFMTRWHDINIKNEKLEQLGIPVEGSYPYHVGRLRRVD